MRRGWGLWRPSERLVQRVRAELMRETDFDHGFTRWSEKTMEESEGEFNGLVERGGLSQVELVRLGGLPPARVMRPERLLCLLTNWVAIRRQQIRRRVNGREVLVEESEFDRLQRLERLIMEENVINAERNVDLQIPGRRG